MYAEIITIGDEILIGQVIDSNSAFIAKSLNKIGVSVYQITSVQDGRNHILKALKEAEENADIIILTGGLGPTKDDITKKTISDYFEDELVRNESVTENIHRLWKNFNQAPSQVNLDQALIPSKAEALMNVNGSAPGMWIVKNEKVFISLPGVPYEMMALMDSEVIPRLRNSYQFPYILHKTVLTYGIGESNLAAMIEQWEDALPKFVKLAYLPNFGKVRLRLSGKSNDKTLLEQTMQQHIERLLPLIKEYFVGFEEDTSIEAIIGKLLTDRNMTVAVAESCTGGSIAESFTANSGASKYFKGSIVSYATESKINILKIEKSFIDNHSVVSKEVVEAMAQSVLSKFEVDYAIATTGNAGPTKGDSDAEVGTVFIAIATKDKVFSQSFNFGNHREKVIKRATTKAFEMLYKEILKKS